MPYEIVKQGGKFVLRNSKTKRVHGRHASRAKAQAQMRALYANVNEEASADGSPPVLGKSEMGPVLVEGQSLSEQGASNAVAPGVLVRQPDGSLTTVTPHQARRLFFSSAPVEGRRVETRRTKPQ